MRPAVMLLLLVVACSSRASGQDGDAGLDGGTLSPCAAADQAHGSLGCEFFAADLSNQFELLHGLSFGTPPCPFLGSELELVHACVFDGNASGLCDADDDCSDALIGSCQATVECVNDAQHAPFALAVANPDPANPVEVTLDDADGHTHTRTLGPGETSAFYPQRLGFPDRSLEQSGLTRSAYRLTSTRPVAAYQFTSLANSYDFSAGASLLLPAAALGQEYRVLDMPSLRRRPDTHDNRATVTIIAVRPGATRVEVTPSADIAAGDGFARVAAGAPRTFMLAQYDTLDLEIDKRGDASGTRVIADQAIAVFAGHEGAEIATPGAEDGCCSDHLEEELPPVQAWGRDHVVVRSQPRQYHEKDLVRVLALRAATTVTVDPPVATCPVLAAGGVCELWIDEDVHLSTSEPVLVAHLLAGTGGLTVDSGDPSLSFVAPVEQWRKDYTVLVPTDYAASYVSLATNAGASVHIDGVDVSTMLHALASGGVAAGRLPLAPGAHHIVCDAGCSVEIYGWDEAVSYMFAGGLGLESIVK